MHGGLIAADRLQTLVNACSATSPFCGEIGWFAPFYLGIRWFAPLYIGLDHLPHFSFFFWWFALFNYCNHFLNIYCFFLHVKRHSCPCGWFTIWYRTNLFSLQGRVQLKQLINREQIISTFFTWLYPTEPGTHKSWIDSVACVVMFMASGEADPPHIYRSLTCDWRRFSKRWSIYIFSVIQLNSEAFGWDNWTKCFIQCTQLHDWSSTSC